MRKSFFYLILFFVHFFSFTGVKAQCNVEDVVALKNILATQTNKDLLDKVWIGTEQNKPDADDLDDDAWDVVDWESDIKGLLWKDDLSGKILTQIDWSNFGSPVQITGSLKISDLKHFTKLFCYNNDLTGLILTNLPQLQEIEAGYNELESFSLNGFPELRSLDLISNKLKNLTLTDLPKLEYLNCSHSFLATLNINHFFNLNHLDCSDSKLTKLDISSLQKMNYLACFRNKLKELAVYTAAPWIELSCGNNNLPFSQLPADGEIKTGYYKYTPQILTSILKQGESYTFEQGSHSSGTISVASCSDNNGVALAGYSLNNDTFTPPAGFSGELVLKVTHSELSYFDDPDNGFDYSYMELHLTIEKTNHPPIPPDPVDPILHTVTVPIVEGATTYPEAGEHLIENGNTMTLLVFLPDDYDQSDVRLVANGDTIYSEESKLRAIAYTFLIPVTSDTEVEVVGVKKNSPIGIAESAKEEGAKVWTSPGCIHVSWNAVSGRRYAERNTQNALRIYTISGKLVIDEPFSFLRSAFCYKVPAGLYLIVIGDTAMKVMVND